MKTLLVICAFCLTAAIAPSLQAQDFTPDTMLVLREVFKKPFPTVWKTVKKILADKGCQIESEKQNFDEKTETYKGNIRSEACVFVSGEDSTRDVLMQYGKVPMIRGGVWNSGRIQYTFAIKDLPDKTVQVVLTCEVSGYEAYITNQIHFWYGNGILENQMLETLKAALAAPAEQKK